MLVCMCSCSLRVSFANAFSIDIVIAFELVKMYRNCCLSHSSKSKRGIWHLTFCDKGICIPWIHLYFLHIHTVFLMCQIKYMVSKLRSGEVKSEVKK